MLRTIALITLTHSIASLRTEAVHHRFEDGKSDDVPGRFIYDPQAKKSLPNAKSVAFKGDAKSSAPIELPFPIENGSFT